MQKCKIYKKNFNFNRYLKVLIEFKYLYCNLGLTLEKGDVDGKLFYYKYLTPYWFSLYFKGDLIDDLVIGSPYASTKGDQSGFIGVLLSKEKCNFKWINTYLKLIFSYI